MDEMEMMSDMERMVREIVAALGLIKDDLISLFGLPESFGKYKYEALKMSLSRNNVAIIIVSKNTSAPAGSAMWKTDYAPDDMIKRGYRPPDRTDRPKLDPKHCYIFMRKSMLPGDTRSYVLQLSNTGIMSSAEQNNRFMLSFGRLVASSDGQTPRVWSTADEPVEQPERPLPAVNPPAVMPSLPLAPTTTVPAATASVTTPRAPQPACGLATEKYDVRGRVQGMMHEMPSENEIYRMSAVGMCGVVRPSTALDKAYHKVCGAPKTALPVAQRLPGKTATGGLSTKGPHAASGQSGLWVPTCVDSMMRRFNFPGSKLISNGTDTVSGADVYIVAGRKAVSPGMCPLERALATGNIVLKLVPTVLKDGPDERAAFLEKMRKLAAANRGMGNAWRYQIARNVSKNTIGAVAHEALVGEVVRDVVTFGGLTQCFGATYFSGLCPDVTGTFGQVYPSGTAVAYLMMERVGSSFDSFFEAYTQSKNAEVAARRMLSVLCQALHALSIANLAVGFVHNDPHGVNLRIKHVVEYATRPWALLWYDPTARRSRWVIIDPDAHGGYLAKFIDMGRSIVNIACASSPFVAEISDIVSPPAPASPIPGLFSPSGDAARVGVGVKETDKASIRQRMAVRVGAATRESGQLYRAPSELASFGIDANPAHARFGVDVSQILFNAVFQLFIAPNWTQKGNVAEAVEMLIDRLSPEVSPTSLLVLASIGTKLGQMLQTDKSEFKPASFYAYATWARAIGRFSAKSTTAMPHGWVATLRWIRDGASREFGDALKDVTATLTLLPTTEPSKTFDIHTTASHLLADAGVALSRTDGVSASSIKAYEQFACLGMLMASRDQHLSEADVCSAVLSLIGIRGASAPAIRSELAARFASRPSSAEVIAIRDVVLPHIAVGMRNVANYSPFPVAGPSHSAILHAISAVPNIISLDSCCTALKDASPGPHSPTSAGSSALSAGKQPVIFAAFPTLALTKSLIPAGDAEVLTVCRVCASPASSPPSPSSSEPRGGHCGHPLCAQVIEFWATGISSTVVDPTRILVA